jgi:hypothetical protein
MTTAVRVRNRPSATQLLARVLDTPELAAELRALPPSVLARLVDRVGLEDAGELVALATTEQLVEVFDEDLWKNRRPGQEERFDDARFLLWLEALSEAGDALVAERLSALSEDLLALAFGRRIFVLPLDSLRSELEQGDDAAEAAEKALSNCLSEEFDEFVVVARNPDGWDVVLAALLALDRDQHQLLVRLFEQIAAASSSYIEDAGGLSAALSAEEMLESDALAGRDDRRAARGYVAPRDAAAFLKLARVQDETPATQHDPLTRAYFRDVERTRTAARPADAAQPGKSLELAGLLRAAGVTEAPAPPLLPGGSAAPGEPAFARAMRLLRERDPGLFAERGEELAYLANVLVAGAQIENRRVRPIEAVRAAIAICSRGLELCVAAPGAKTPDEALLAALLAHPADGLFRIGFSALAPRFSGGAPDLSLALLGQS